MWAGLNRKRLLIGFPCLFCGTQVTRVQKGYCNGLSVRVVLSELTVPWDSESSFWKALDRKTKRYESLTEDLKSKGYKTLNKPLEIGCMGVVNSRNLGVLAAICSLVGIWSLKKFRGTPAKLAQLWSYRIWSARQSQEWRSVEL